MHPNFNNTVSYEQYVHIDDLAVGDVIQQQYWQKNNSSGRHKWFKVIAIGVCKVFGIHDDGTECAYSYNKYNWTYYVPKEILCYDNRKLTAVFCKEDEVVKRGYSILRTESGDLIVKE